VLEEIDELLELTLLERVGLPLISSSSSMSITILGGNQAIEILAEELEKCLFTNSLMGTTIQDGGKRERNDEPLLITLR